MPDDTRNKHDDCKGRSELRTACFFVFKPKGMMLNMTPTVLLAVFCLAAVLTLTLVIVEKALAGKRKLPVEKCTRLGFSLRFAVLGGLIHFAVAAGKSPVHTFLLILLLFSGFVAAVFDWNHRVIPNEVVAAIFVAALAMMLLGISYTTAVGFFTGAMLGGGIYLLPYLLGKKAGGGDVKLMSAIGAVTGVQGILTVSVFMGFLILAVTWFLVKSKSVVFNRPIPMGPYMAAGMLLFMITK